MVIFGAGASYDSNPVFADSYQSYRPPLTKDLFDARSDFDAALDAYLQFQTIGSRLRHLPAGLLLEQRLAQLRAEAESIPGRHRELMAVRFYLQQILWTTPDAWHLNSHGSSNYSTVIGCLQDWQVRSEERVALVTFNYDTLLDRAYSATFDSNPAQSLDLAGYVVSSC